MKETGVSNHDSIIYDLLLGTPKANLSRSMQWLGNTYTRRFNLPLSCINNMAKIK